MEEVPPALPAPVTAFTGFKMHLRTWRFKFDATPNRRPHVSQTKAERKKKRLLLNLNYRNNDHRTHPFHQYGQGDAISQKVRTERSCMHVFMGDHARSPFSTYSDDQSYHKKKVGTTLTKWTEKKKSTN